MLDPFLFPPCVAVESADPATVEGPLYAEEERAIERAVQGRRLEYRAARVLARRALERIGFEGRPIPSGPDRAPIWPSGVVGTITHTKGLCAVAIARSEELASVGCDVERTRPLREGVLRKILTTAELERFGTRPDIEAPLEATLLFSAKEAFYKCLYPLRPRFVGFQEVEVDLDLEANAFSVRAPGLEGVDWPGLVRFEGRCAWNERFVQASVVAYREGP